MGEPRMNGAYRPFRQRRRSDRALRAARRFCAGVVPRDPGRGARHRPLWSSGLRAARDCPQSLCGGKPERPRARFSSRNWTDTGDLRPRHFSRSWRVPEIGAGGCTRPQGFSPSDATCPLVAKVHREAEIHHRRGRLVLLISHAGHRKSSARWANCRTAQCASCSQIRGYRRPFRGDDEEQSRLRHADDAFARRYGEIVERS